MQPFLLVSWQVSCWLQLHVCAHGWWCIDAHHLPSTAAQL
jgi:hypothetical protein